MNPFNEELTEDTPEAVVVLRSRNLEAEYERDLEAEYADKSSAELEAIAELKDIDISHVWLKMLAEKDYRGQLILDIEKVVQAEAEQAMDDDEMGTFPRCLDGVVVHQHTFTLHDWSVEEAVAKEDKHEDRLATVTVLIRIHRKGAYFFWKIGFVLHMLTLLSLSQFFFPGDPNGMQLRVAISTTMFLALCGLLYVAAETLPRLEYLTSLDKLIVMSTTVVFFINVWNGVLLRSWVGEGCPAVEELRLPGWLRGFVDLDKHEHASGRDELFDLKGCYSETMDKWAFRFFFFVLAATDVVLFGPAKWRRSSEQKLADMDEEHVVKFLEKRAMLSRASSHRNVGNTSPR